METGHEDRIDVRIALPDLVRHALDHHYSLDRAASGLGGLMLERDLIKRKGDTDSPRLRELDRLIPPQETRAVRKLRGDKMFDRLGRLRIRVEAT